MAELYAGVYCGLGGIAVATVAGAVGTPDFSAYIEYGDWPSHVGWRVGRALVVVGWCWQELQRAGRPALVALADYPEPAALGEGRERLRVVEVGALLRGMLLQNKVPVLEVPPGNAVGRDVRAGESLAKSRALTLARVARGGPLRCEDPRVIHAG